MDNLSFSEQKVRCDLALALLEAGVTRITAPTPQPFTFDFSVTNGPRNGPVTPEIVKLAAVCMQNLQIYQGLDFDAVTSDSWISEPFARTFARIVGKSSEKPKPYLSLKRVKNGNLRVQGDYSNVSKVLVIKVLLGQADITLKTIEAVSCVGMWVSDVIALVDCEQNGRRRLGNEWGCDVFSVFTTTELSQLYTDHDRMPRPFHATGGSRP